MDLEDRRQLAEELVSVISKRLSGDLCTGTGKQMRERMLEMSTLLSRVTAVVMHEGPADSELLSRIQRYEGEMVQSSAKAPAPLLVVK